MNKYIASSLIFLSCSLHAIESKLEIRNREAGGVGYNTGYSSLDYFLMTDGDLEFLLDLRGHVFNDGRGAGNAGVGVRYPIKDDKFLLGANAFYDIRQAKDLLANQIGAGFECLSKSVDFRLNGYLPVGKKKDLETREFKQFASSTVFIKRKLKAALPCIEAEVGTPLPKHFYFAVGSYYLFNQKESSLKVGSALGVKLRAEADIGKYFTLGFALTYDRIFKTRPQGYISVNFAFEKRKCLKKDDDCYVSERRNLWHVPIMRNEIIPIEDKKKSREPLLGKNDDPIRFMFVNNTAALGGDGSFEKPFASLKEAEKNSIPGDVIYVFPGDHTPKNMDEGIILKEDQILASSGAPLVIDEIVIPPQTPGVAPVITNINHPHEPFITNPGNTHLGDFFFIPPWEYIFGRGIDVDPFADARAEGFVIVDADQPPAPIDLGNVGIINDYQVHQPPVQPYNPVIIENYGN